MNYRFTTIILTVALLLVILVPSTQAAPLNPSDAAQVEVVAPAGDYDFTQHGTAWLREKNSNFTVFKQYGWGTFTTAKLAGSYWVHIPVPYPSVIAGSAMKIKYVEFCAQSSNGASTKPVTMDLWEYPGRFLTVNINWQANNDKQCFGYTFPSPAFHQDLGISVKLTYANTIDSITLYKAWVRVTP